MTADESPEPQARRRKTRKGTRSCWECKRRKIRCLFESPGDVVCISCTKRCTECISQEFPDHAKPSTKTRLVGERFGRMEAMIAQLAKQAGTTPGGLHPQPAATAHRSQRGASSGIPTPAASDTLTVVAPDDVASGSAVSSPSDEIVIPGYLAYEQNVPTEISDAPHPQVVIDSAAAPSTIGSDRLEKMSRALLMAYPDRKFVEILTAASTLFINTYKSVFYSYRELEEMIELPELERPEMLMLHAQHTPETHPVVIAQQMLLLANILQQADKHTLAQLNNLSEEPKVVMHRLAKAAIGLVTANDEMLGTAEGLECLLLESMYQANRGNLRLSWLARRRLIALSQAIGIHRRPCRALVIRSLQGSCVLDPAFVWFRILYIDRFLSLMLGLPAASLDTSMIAEPALSQDTLMGQLERRHCVAAGRILDRNDRDPSADDFALTQSIDAELQKAANLMPSRWWLEPNLQTISNDKQLLWESIRLVNQTFHFYLLHQLHLPYMLLYSSSSANRNQYDYSRTTCMSASRDILSRCLKLQTHSGLPYSTCAIDFLALMASLTLLLTHLSCRRNSSSGSIHAHQRLSDRALMEQVLENMERVTSGDSNEPGSKGARILQQLLAIDTDPNMAERRSPVHAAKGAAELDKTNSLRLFVPYFGVVIVSTDGIVTTEPERATYAPLASRDEGHREGLAPTPTEGDALQQRQEVLSTGQNGGPQLFQQSLGTMLVTNNELDPVSAMGHMDNFAPSEPRYPPPTAGADQWALQGVDFAFFDSLMRETPASVEESGGGLWPWTVPTGT